MAWDGPLSQIHGCGKRNNIIGGCQLVNVISTNPSNVWCTSLPKPAAVFLADWHLEKFNASQWRALACESGPYQVTMSAGNDANRKKKDSPMRRGDFSEEQILKIHEPSHAMSIVMDKRDHYKRGHSLLTGFSALRTGRCQEFASGTWDWVFWHAGLTVFSRVESGREAVRLESKYIEWWKWTAHLSVWPVVAS